MEDQKPKHRIVRTYQRHTKLLPLAERQLNASSPSMSSINSNKPEAPSQTPQDDSTMQPKQLNQAQTEFLQLFQHRPTTAVHPYWPSGVSLKQKSKINNLKRKEEPIQTVLNFGQRRMDRPTLCKECGMAFISGRADDKRAHDLYHRQCVVGIEFTPCWEQEVMVDSTGVANQEKGRIVMLHGNFGTMTATQRNKLNEILSVVQRELGAVHLSQDHLRSCKVSSHLLRNKDYSLQIFLYVRPDHLVSGCLVAEPCTKAYLFDDTLTDDQEATSLSLDDPVDVMCGVSRIWVGLSSRRKGIGSQLLTALRHYFTFGMTLHAEQVAFSQPTTLGRKLARTFYGQCRYPVYLSSISEEGAM